MRSQVSSLNFQAGKCCLAIARPDIRNMCQLKGRVYEIGGKRTVVENAHAVVEGMRRELCLGVLQGCFGDLSIREGSVFDELGSWSLGRSELLGVDGHGSPAVFFHLGCSVGHGWEYSRDLWEEV